MARYFNVSELAMAFRIKNTIGIDYTNDYLIVKPREFALIADGKTIVSTDKNLIVPPNEETNKVISVASESTCKAGILISVPEEFPTELFS